MKKTVTFLFLILSTSLFAQQVGSAGVLLKNEASKSDMNSRSYQSVNQTNSFQNKGGSNRNDSNRNNVSTINRDNGRAPNYRWKNNLGYAELFLRIPENGYFTVVVDDQEINTGTGKFRFFDLSSGRKMLSIYENGYLLYRTPVSIQNNTRLILDFFPNYGLYLLDSYPVRNQNYGINEWDDIWNNPYGNNNYNSGPNYNNGSNSNNGYRPRAMNDRDFSTFISRVKSNNPFDDNKISVIREQQKFNDFSAAQIEQLLSLLSFEKNKVTLGKDLYPSCVDPQNFYIVYDAFAFNNNKKELMDFVAKFKR